MKYGLIGEKLGHSLSVPVHQAIGKYEYELCPLKPEELDGFLTRREFSGINVTIPYKKDVIPYLKEISEEARLCGAVNTVVNRDGVLFGYNTDVFGLKALFSFAGISLQDKKVLILGSGGTSGTALALCRASGVLRVERVSRSGKGDCITYEEAKTRADTEIIINTTPSGMYPMVEESPIDLSFFPRLCGVVDAIYNPLATRLLQEAAERGIPHANGLYMLVAQAVYAAEIFTGEPLEDKIRPIYEKIAGERKNIVLIGMPGSGKSTIGKALASRWNKTFIDCDEEIVKKAKKSIPQIFREEGEEAFRDLEEKVIREIALRQGVVIATGGGAVLRQENVKNLRAGGDVIFLDAPLSDLIPTDDRPLSSNPLDLKRRYEERYGIYQKAATVSIPVSRDLEENLSRIEKELQ